MLFPKYALEDLSVGNDSIIGKSNIEEFFSHISMHKDIEDKSLAELAPSYEVAAYLVHMLEARFVSLNPFMQQMFLKLHDIEDFEKKDFILETLRKEFRDVAIEARKVFKRFHMLGSRVEVVGTNKEEIKVPIPCILLVMWVCPLGTHGSVYRVRPIMEVDKYKDSKIDVEKKKECFNLYSTRTLVKP
jgi:hypothetical protein